jgi:hypothetical protein
MTQKENSQHAMDNNLNSRIKKVKVLNIETKEETVYANIKQACDKLGISYGMTKRCIANNKPYGGFIFTKI